MNYTIEPFRVAACRKNITGISSISRILPFEGSAPAADFNSRRFNRPLI